MYENIGAVIINKPRFNEWATLACSAYNMRG